MLKSTGVGATLSFNTRPVRRTLQVQHSGRRLISHTYKRKGGVQSTHGNTLATGCPQHRGILQAVMAALTVHDSS
ncbi:hypothetical protein WJX77_004994 [Trebouxia sp. C0004]